jgi:hypothetical protein
LFENLKKKIGYFLLRKTMIKNLEESNFNQFVTSANNYLVIFPTDDMDFHNGIDIAKYFTIHKKNVTVLIQDIKRNLVNLTNNFNIIEYGINDISKFGLPNKKFITELSKYNFDILIDLERDENLFINGVTSSVKAKYKVGFKKNEIENLYNFQIINPKLNSEISYRNLLNSLRMF